MGMTPAIDVLLDVRALLARKDGWIQNARSGMVNGQFAYCIEGALEAAEPKGHRYVEAWARVQGVLGQPIPEYNDAPGRQQSEVVETIDRAIQAEWHGDPVPTVRLIVFPSDLVDLNSAPYIPAPDAA